MLKLLLAGGAIIVVIGVIFWAGHSAGSAKVEARVAREVAAERQRQAEAGNAALDTARKQAEAREIENAALEAEVDGFERELATRPDGACIISPADGLRLRNIR